jgi:acyl-CoA dehydrogenase
LDRAPPIPAGGGFTTGSIVTVNGGYSLSLNWESRMDFALSPEIDGVCRRIRAFVDERIIPLESDPASYDGHENLSEDLLEGLRSQARAEGLWAISMPRSRGGMELGRVGMAACYEEMNRSIFGPVVFNAAAPDDGNMWVLNACATEAQKDRWLQPIIDGKVRSAIVMTEPHPGAGSDPAGMTLTTAERSGEKWVIHGRKWFITGAEAASHFILLARTSHEPRRELTTFLFHKDQPGWRIVRRIPIMGPEEHGGHCELEFDGLEVPDENRLMDVGRGMKVVQTRLGTARLTHCMRWLGMAKRAMEIAGAYIEEREAFGTKLAERESIRLMTGDAAMQIHIGRLLVMNAAWKLDQGDFAKTEVSAAKIQVADALHQAVDTSIQLCGGKGYSKDTLLEWMYRYARQARLVDGASEVHKMILADAFRKEGLDFWSWGA